MTNRSVVNEWAGGADFVTCHSIVRLRCGSQSKIFVFFNSIRNNPSHPFVSAWSKGDCAGAHWVPEWVHHWGGEGKLALPNGYLYGQPIRWIRSQPIWGTGSPEVAHWIPLIEIYPKPLRDRKVFECVAFLLGPWQKRVVLLCLVKNDYSTTAKYLDRAHY